MNISTTIKLILSVLFQLPTQAKLRGVKNAFLWGVASIGTFVGDKEKWYLIRHKQDITFLKRHITYQMDDAEGEKETSHSYIFTFWWQGKDSMPPIIRSTISSMKKAAGQHQLIVITKQNYSQWISLPSIIKKRLDEGNIGLAHLSDYFRIALIEKWGGLWLDSTIYCQAAIPEDVFDMNFFTIHALSQSNKYIPRGRWNCQVLGSNVCHNIFFSKMKVALEQYWKTFSKPIDYLFFDALIELLCEEDSNCKELIDSVPMTNTSMHDLLPMLNEEYDYAWLDKNLEEGTWLYKLTYKIPLKTTSPKGKETFYGHLLDLTC